MDSSSAIKEKEIIEEIKNFYTKKNKLRDLLFFLLAINTGLKLNELINLNIRDVKGKSYLTIKHNLGKTVRQIPINKYIQNLINEVAGTRKYGEPLFVSNFGGRIDRTTVYKNFKDVCKELGLDKSLTASSLRKTFGYHYYMAYKDLSLLQWLFNQSTVIETMKYIGIEENLNSRFQIEFSL